MRTLCLVLRSFASGIRLPKPVQVGIFQIAAYLRFQNFFNSKHVKILHEETFCHALFCAVLIDFGHATPVKRSENNTLVALEPTGNPEHSTCGDGSIRDHGMIYGLHSLLSHLRLTLDKVEVFNE
jgi:hypothetical protein